MHFCRMSKEINCKCKYNYGFMQVFFREKEKGNPIELPSSLNYSPRPLFCSLLFC